MNHIPLRYLLIATSVIAISATSAQEGVEIDFSEVPTVHFPAGGQIVSAYPAFEDYMFMFFDLCDAMGFSVENECSIYPLNASIGGNALATITDGSRSSPTIESCHPSSAQKGPK